MSRAGGHPSPRHTGDQLQYDEQHHAPESVGRRSASDGSFRGRMQDTAEAHEDAYMQPPAAEEEEQLDYDISQDMGYADEDAEQPCSNSETAGESARFPQLPRQQSVPVADGEQHKAPIAIARPPRVHSTVCRASDNWGTHSDTPHSLNGLDRDAAERGQPQTWRRNSMQLRGQQVDAAGHFASSENRDSSSEPQTLAAVPDPETLQQQQRELDTRGRWDPSQSGEQEMQRNSSPPFTSPVESGGQHDSQHINARSGATGPAYATPVAGNRKFVSATGTIYTNSNTKLDRKLGSADGRRAQRPAVGAGGSSRPADSWTDNTGRGSGWVTGGSARPPLHQPAPFPHADWGHNPDYTNPRPHVPASAPDSSRVGRESARELAIRLQTINHYTSPPTHPSMNNNQGRETPRDFQAGSTNTGSDERVQQRQRRPDGGIRPAGQPYTHSLQAEQGTPSSAREPRGSGLVINRGRLGHSRERAEHDPPQARGHSQHHERENSDGESNRHVNHSMLKSWMPTASSIALHLKLNRPAETHSPTSNPDSSGSREPERKRQRGSTPGADADRLVSSPHRSSSTSAHESPNPQDPSSFVKSHPARDAIAALNTGYDGPDTGTHHPRFKSRFSTIKSDNMPDHPIAPSSSHKRQASRSPPPPVHRQQVAHRQQVVHQHARDEAARRLVSPVRSQRSGERHSGPTDNGRQHADSSGSSSSSSRGGSSSSGNSGNSRNTNNDRDADVMEDNVMQVKVVTTPHRERVVHSMHRNEASGPNANLSPNITAHQLPLLYVTGFPANSRSEHVQQLITALLGLAGIHVTDVSVQEDVSCSRDGFAVHRHMAIAQLTTVRMQGEAREVLEQCRLLPTLHLIVQDQAPQQTPRVAAAAPAVSVQKTSLNQQPSTEQAGCGRGTGGGSGGKAAARVSSDGRSSNSIPVLSMEESLYGQPSIDNRENHQQPPRQAARRHDENIKQQAPRHAALPGGRVLDVNPAHRLPATRISSSGTSGMGVVEEGVPSMSRAVAGSERGAGVSERGTGARERRLSSGVGNSPWGLPPLDREDDNLLVQEGRLAAKTQQHQHQQQSLHNSQQHQQQQQQPASFNVNRGSGSQPSGSSLPAVADPIPRQPQEWGQTQGQSVTTLTKSPPKPAREGLLRQTSAQLSPLPTPFANSDPSHVPIVRSSSGAKELDGGEAAFWNSLTSHSTHSAVQVAGTRSAPKYTFKTQSSLPRPTSPRPQQTEHPSNPYFPAPEQPVPAPTAPAATQQPHTRTPLSHGALPGNEQTRILPFAPVPSAAVAHKISNQAPTDIYNADLISHRREAAESSSSQIPVHPSVNVAILNGDCRVNAHNSHPHAYPHEATGEQRMVEEPEFDVRPQHPLSASTLAMQQHQQQQHQQQQRQYQQFQQPHAEMAQQVDHSMENVQQQQQPAQESYPRKGSDYLSRADQSLPGSFHEHQQQQQQQQLGGKASGGGSIGPGCLVIVAEAVAENACSSGLSFPCVAGSVRDSGQSQERHPMGRQVQSSGGKADSFGARGTMEVLDLSHHRGSPDGSQLRYNRAEQAAEQQQSSAGVQHRQQHQQQPQQQQQQQLLLQQQQQPQLQVKVGQPVLAQHQQRLSLASPSSSGGRAASTDACEARQGASLSRMAVNSLPLAAYSNQGCDPLISAAFQNFQQQRQQTDLIDGVVSSQSQPLVTGAGLTLPQQHEVKQSGSHSRGLGLVDESPAFNRATSLSRTEQLSQSVLMPASQQLYHLQPSFQAGPNQYVPPAEQQYHMLMHNPQQQLQQLSTQPQQQWQQQSAQVQQQLQQQQREQQHQQQQQQQQHNQHLQWGGHVVGNGIAPFSFSSTPMQEPRDFNPALPSSQHPRGATITPPSMLSDVHMRELIHSFSSVDDGITPMFESVPRAALMQQPAFGSNRSQGLLQQQPPIANSDLGPSQLHRFSLNQMQQPAPAGQSQIKLVGTQLQLQQQQLQQQMAVARGQHDHTNIPTQGHEIVGLSLTDQNPLSNLQASSTSAHQRHSSSNSSHPHLGGSSLGHGQLGTASNHDTVVNHFPNVMRMQPLESIGSSQGYISTPFLHTLQSQMQRMPNPEMAMQAGGAAAMYSHPSLAENAQCVQVFSGGGPGTSGGHGMVAALTSLETAGLNGSSGYMGPYFTPQQPRQQQQQPQGLSGIETHISGSSSRHASQYTSQSGPPAGTTQITSGSSFPYPAQQQGWEAPDATGFNRSSTIHAEVSVHPSLSLGHKLSNIHALCLKRDSLLRMSGSEVFGSEAVGFFVRLRPDFGILAPGSMHPDGYRLAVITQASVGKKSGGGSKYSNVLLTVSTGNASHEGNLEGVSNAQPVVGELQAWIMSGGETSMSQVNTLLARRAAMSV